MTKTSAKYLNANIQLKRLMQLLFRSLTCNFKSTCIRNHIYGTILCGKKS